MNRGTLLTVAVALAAAGGAWSMRPEPVEMPVYQDEGEPLFPDFTDPLAATSLQVIAWDDDAAQTVDFKVEQKAGRWVIPSHNDYPADATERMGAAAASFVGVRKDQYLGDDPADHAKFGVLAPDAGKGEGDEKGKRITLGDASGKTLVDVIVGKKVEGKQDTYYVRYADEEASSGANPNRVYAAKIELDISTKFGDWIEKDLLHVERDEIVRLEYDPYAVDESKGQVVGRNPIVAEFDESAERAEQWQAIAEMPLPEGKVLDGNKIRSMVNSVANIKIVGVRPRPQQLRLGDLQSKGFFVSARPDGAMELFGNEGEAAIVTKDGLRYRLLFGEVTYESGLALTSGVGGASEPEEGDDETEGKTASRYMWVDVTYDPSADTTLDENAEALLSPAEESEGDEPEDDEPEPFNAEDEKKKVQGQERSVKLNKRFSSWFYVISDSSFKQVHKDREGLFKDAPEPEPEPEDAPEP